MAFLLTPFNVVLYAVSTVVKSSKRMCFANFDLIATKNKDNGLLF
jgi:hypothetical protein